MKIAILLGLMVFLLGCLGVHVDPLVTKLSFEFEETFIIREEITYFNEANDKTSMTIEIKSFEDSRCPEGVVCVWEGEQGVTLFVKTLETEFEIILKETTMPNNSFGTLSFELVSIDIDNGRAELRVTREPNIYPGPEKQWFSIEPIQCNGNEWDKWFDKNADEYFPCPEGVFCKPIGEFQIIIKYFEIEHNIEILKLDSREKYDDVCAACDCPRGDEIAVLINSSNSAKMQELGFTSMGNIACTEDARICPDGSGVGREAPFCEFAACPIVDITNCPKDLQTCPDGSLVGRIYPSCEFATCPETDFLIKKTDSPGLVPEEFYEIVVTEIYETGRVTIETTKGYGEDATVSLKLKQLSEDQISDLTNFILNSSFFEITMQDAQTCITDGPSKQLEINLDGKTNTVSGIGLSCDPSAVEAANGIIQEINLLVEN